ncbi:MAG: pantoate--beta-alanine ligase [Desulfobacteraceae bacterium 4572_87]|nr:MAG: pantoate--beta-alanine ligase [Desulfobacteraceae bacterium 4572_87]
MEMIKTVDFMQQASDAIRMKGESLALVPTMGFLHEGHLTLMRAGKDHCDRLVVSLFVNPTQFGPNEDFKAYPRDTEGDLKKAEDAGADMVFMPSPAEMYPQGAQTSVVVKDLPNHLCGLSRPGHFDGVTTVVAKLFHIVKPHAAVFGQKDYQQLAVISRMVMDLDMDVRIIGVPTVREADGLAMSSRNSYLNPEERKSALSLKKSLNLAQRLFQEGEKNAQMVKEFVKSYILEHPSTEIDYIALCDPITLEDVNTLTDGTLMALAVRVGKTRLIDNGRLKK